MNKLLDYKLKITQEEVKEYIKNNSQFSNIDPRYLPILEEELLNFFNNSTLSFSCNFEDDFSISLSSSLFNGNSIIKNKNILIENDYIINE